MEAAAHLPQFFPGSGEQSFLPAPSELGISRCRVEYLSGQ
jgi:hypothetical protein